MNIFFTADTHFGHSAIIEFEDRPFKTVEVMNRELIKKWNSVVSSDSDLVYVLGDFHFKGPQYLSQIEAITKKLKGTKILIPGNHDRLSIQQYIECGFWQVKYPYDSLIINGRLSYMFHDPALAVAAKMAPDYYMSICGHVHSLFRDLPDKKVLNVGVDLWDYKPVSYKQVNNIIEEWDEKDKEASSSQNDQESHTEQI